MPAALNNLDATNRIVMLQEMSDDNVRQWVQAAIHLEDTGPQHQLLELNKSGQSGWVAHAHSVLAVMLGRPTSVGFDELCQRLTDRDTRWFDAFDHAETFGTLSMPTGSTELKDERTFSAVRVACAAQTRSEWAMPALARWMMRVDPSLDAVDLFARFEQTALRLIQAAPLFFEDNRVYLDVLPRLAHALDLPDTVWHAALLRPRITEDRLRNQDVDGQAKQNLPGWADVLIQSGDEKALGRLIRLGLAHQEDTEEVQARLGAWLERALSNDALLPMATLLVTHTPVLQAPCGHHEWTWAQFLQDQVTTAQRGPADDAEVLSAAQVHWAASLLRQQALNERSPPPVRPRRRA